MVLTHLIQDRGLEEAEDTVPQMQSSQMQTAAVKTKRRHLFCLFLLANIIVWNAVYGLHTAEEDKPLWKAAVMDNLICKLWRKCPRISKSPQKGVITGILFNEVKPVALIDNQLVHEGDTIGSIKVIQIGPKKILFEKKGKRWMQGTQERPDAAW
ncbi:hypothetical protein ACFL1G_08900 [Planctomycetota bacterium]